MVGARVFPAHSFSEGAGWRPSKTSEIGLSATVCLPALVFVFSLIMRLPTLFLMIEERQVTDKGLKTAASRDLRAASDPSGCQPQAAIPRAPLCPLWLIGFCGHFTTASTQAKLLAPSSEIEAGRLLTLDPAPARPYARLFTEDNLKAFRRLLQRTPFYGAYKAAGHYPDYWYWILRGRPERSPHLLKQKVVREYGERYSLKTLVETGTYYGEMVAAQNRRFDRIYSIEFAPELAERARRKFAAEAHIKIFCGDSRVILPEVLAQLNAPALFWLDG